jgi:hypothetical protein
MTVQTKKSSSIAVSAADKKTDRLYARTIVRPAARLIAAIARKAKSAGPAAR